MKETPAPRKKAAPPGAKFHPCGKVVAAGMFKGGAECHGGLLVYMHMQSGKLERCARECQCMLDWRNTTEIKA